MTTGSLRCASLLARRVRALRVTISLALVASLAVLVSRFDELRRRCAPASVCSAVCMWCSVSVRVLSLTTLSALFGGSTGRTITFTLKTKRYSRLSFRRSTRTLSGVFFFFFSWRICAGGYVIGWKRTVTFVQCSVCTLRHKGRGGRRSGSTLFYRYTTSSIGPVLFRRVPPCALSYTATTLATDPADAVK